MYCLNLKSYDPFFNLAIEEILLKNSRQEYFILGVNNPAVIIGKHQTCHREVNTKFITNNHIPVIRRISGGGTVYHDNGNLNFSFIRRSESGKQVDFRKYTQPVIEFLGSLGVNARFEAKNDLKVEGYKVSGNAEHIYHDRVLHHGTLLFRSTLEMLRNSIRKDTSGYSSRAVQSNPSSVMNLYEMMNCFQDINEFRKEMMNYFLNHFSDYTLHELSDTEISEAESLAESKYKTWEWNWAYGPEYSFKNSFDIQGIPYTCELFVEEGIIRTCVIEGSHILETASKKLIGLKHMVKDLSDFFKSVNINLSDDEIFNFF